MSGGDGDCYVVAATIVLEDPKFTLCHGTPLGTGGEARGVRYGHAWTEFEIEGQWFVLDQSNGGDHLLPRDLYYAIGRIDPAGVARYSRERTRELMLEHEHWGPWT